MSTTDKPNLGDPTYEFEIYEAGPGGDFFDHGTSTNREEIEREAARSAAKYAIGGPVEVKMFIRYPLDTTQPPSDTGVASHLDMRGLSKLRDSILAEYAKCDPTFIDGLKVALNHVGETVAWLELPAMMERVKGEKA